MHFLDFFHAAEVAAARLRRVIADIALHIALVIDIEERKTWMILVLWTNPAIKRTSSENRSKCCLWEVRLLEIVVTLLVILEIG